MSKITLLVPREEMLYLAHNILQEKKYAIGEMRAIQTEHTVTEARNAIASGATILIARGLQASLIKQYTDVPVVEITVTAQEMALLVVKARQIVKKDRPVIAAVGFKNMFCDMTYFDDLYGIQLRTYFASGGADLENKALEALEDGADLLIGGDVAVAAAKERGVPSLFLSITEDSLRTAFAMAESLAFAMGAERRSHAQIEAILDYSFNGVVNIDRDGAIVSLNPVMKEILKAETEDIKGRSFTEIFPDVDQEAFQRVLEGQEESYSSFLEAGGDSVFAVLAPVKVGADTEGAILTCHKVKRQKYQTEEDGRDRKQKRPGGPGPRGTFKQLIQNSKAMEACVRRAKLYSRSDQPVLLMGEPGTEYRLLAESIHNNGVNPEGPFLALSCRGLSASEQRELLFGEKGMVLLLQGGSLLIEDVEALSLGCQYQLAQLIRYRIPGWETPGMKAIRVRIFAYTSLKEGELEALVSQNRFRSDLYYLLKGLVLAIPPLRQRPEDLKVLTEGYLRQICDQYSRFHVLTQGARDCLREQSWPGNLLQLRHFLERLILTAESRSIDEIRIRRLLNELYPAACGDPEDRLKTGTDKATASVFSGGSEEIRIRQALSEHRGSRSRTAEALGISKATLWRKMKQYSIEED